MILYVVYDAVGRVLRWGSCLPAEMALQAALVGESVLEVERRPGTGGGSVFYVDVLEMRLKESPTRPDDWHVWDYLAGEWIDPRELPQLQAAAWERIKTDRDAAEFGGFAWEGQVFDSDQVSQGRIAGAVQLAQLDPAFLIDWTLADNTVIQLDAAQMKSVGAALGAHVSAQHARARLLREVIHAPGVTLEQLAAITFSTEE